jgi:PAS domain S-box-containing protein
MMFHMGSERARRREVQCFWAGIATAIAVAVYRVYITIAGIAREDTTPRVTMDTWMTNGFIVWSLTLFVLAWLFWRDARRRQDELATVLRSIVPDVLLVTDSAGLMQMCTPAVQAMFGYPPDELLQRPVTLLLQERPTVGAEHEIYARLQNAGHEVRPVTGVRKDGVKFAAEIATARLFEQSGTVTLVRDVTERRRVGQLQENLTRMLVHDLRNPLFGISGNLQLVLTQARTLSEDALNRVEASLDFTRDMGDMLHCMTEMTQLESGAWPLQPADADIDRMVDTALATLAAVVNRKRHRIVWSRTPARVRCDAELIGRVILSLLRNAIDAAASGGRIEVRIAVADGRCRVSVEDNGPGIPREYQPLIYDKFAQMPAGPKPKRRATGLSLIFCRLAVEAHGGALGVQSPSTGQDAGDAGQGCTFWFELPVEFAGRPTQSTDGFNAEERAE